MRLFVTGRKGQLGRALERVAAERGDAFVGYDLPELDITDPAAVRAAVCEASPDFVVNCAAFTAVDAAETAAARALAVNGTAVTGLAAAADAVGAVLVQISTDYVFDGTSRRPYREDDPVNPQSVYGKTKLAGERAAAAARRHLVVRTAWLFGEGGNFVGAIRKQIDAGASTLRVVGDQRGCPTYAEDLARALLRLLETGAEGMVHAVNAGEASWFEFAGEIVRQLGAEVTVVPISTAEAARPALRPPYAILDTVRLRELLGGDMRPWQEALGDYLRVNASQNTVRT